jgi:serine/threonine protein kinase
MASPREPFEKAYRVGHVLGKGGFGIVYAGVRNRDGLQVAIKHIAKAKIKDWGQVSSVSVAGAGRGHLPHVNPVVGGERAIVQLSRLQCRSEQAYPSTKHIPLVPCFVPTGTRIVIT